MITLVSCFYPLQGNKSSKNYLELAEPLMNCSLPLIFFSDNHKVIEWVNKKRGTNPTFLHLVSMDDISFFDDKELLEDRMKEYTIFNRNLEKDTTPYILLQLAKMDFIQRALDINPFKSSFFFWIDFGIQHCTQATPEEWKEMEKDLELCCTNHPDKIHHLKICPVQKPKNETWKVFFQHIYHHVAGGLFGGSIDSLEFYTREFKKLWNEILEEGWFQLDEAIFTILTETFPEKFRFWYGDYDGIIRNIQVSRSSFPLIFKNIQYYLDSRNYNEADKLLSTIEPSNEIQTLKFLELLIQNDFYLKNGMFGETLSRYLCKSLLPISFLRRQLQNLMYYKKDPRFYEIMLAAFSRTSIEKWRVYKEKTPKLIYMNQSKEFPFLQLHHENIVASFRKQFLPSKNPVICDFYALLESPVLPLVFLWTHIPFEKDLIELCGYLERNYESLDFCFAYLVPDSKTERPDHPRLLYFSFPFLNSGDEAKIINAWMKILF